MRKIQELTEAELTEAIKFAIDCRRRVANKLKPLEEKERELVFERFRRSRSAESVAAKARATGSERLAAKAKRLLKEENES